MNHKTEINLKLLIAIYAYLGIPTIIFLLGWCRWYIGIPVCIITIISIFLTVKEYKADISTSSLFDNTDRKKWLAIGAILFCWLVLSGVGGYVWQNDDHWWRNTIFQLLVEKQWPVTSGEQGMVYYIGFWMVPALVGKIFGIHAGFSAQFLWAFLGIALFYTLLCVWQKKVAIWPLILFIGFSGLDVIGTLLNSSDVVSFFGVDHLERWAQHYQYSSMTTQLFWVFNQAINAWLVSLLVFLYEKPRNILFTWSLLLITSPLPFVGLLPYIIYFMFKRSDWDNVTGFGDYLKSVFTNFCSVQNILGAVSIGLIVGIYFLGNSAGHIIQMFSAFSTSCLFATIFISIILILTVTLWMSYCFCTRKTKIISGKKLGIPICIFIIPVVLFLLSKNIAWNTYAYKLVFLGLFYLIEAGMYLVLLYDTVADKGLFFLTCIWLFIIPRIIVGTSQDFCMRASIPALILIFVWCVSALSNKKASKVTWILIIVLLLGSITPLHEIKRTLVYSKDAYILEFVQDTDVMTSINFSGPIDTLFWKHIAK